MMLVARVGHGATPVMCPMPRFEIGVTYAVYVSREGVHLRVGICNPSRRVSE